MIIVQLDSEQLKSLIQNALRNVMKDTPKADALPETEKPLNVQQAADFLGIAVPTLYGYTQREEIPFCKRGKRLYFSKDELLQWVKQGRRKTKTEAAAYIAGETDQYLAKKRKG